MTAAADPHSTRSAHSGQAPPRIHRPDAIAAARAFIDLLDGTYDQLVVAGSLRRRLAYADTIAIVAVPTFDTIAADLLGDRTQHADRLDSRMHALLEAGTVQQRLDRNGSPRWGPRAKLLEHDGVRIALYSPEAERFGWVLLFQTGPAVFSRQLLVERGRKTQDGRPGLLPSTVRPRDGWLTWRTSGERIPTPTEAEACRVLGIPAASPWERE
jgi:hypothetical protein